MTEVSLNIYGENDEIVKTYETKHIRWRIFSEVIKLQEKLTKLSPEKQFAAIQPIILSIFPGLTSEELQDADSFDVFNVFKMITNRAAGINSSGQTEKN